MRFKVLVPNELTRPQSALDFVDSLREYEDSPDVTFDFRNLRFARPFATLVTANGVRRFVKERLNRGLETKVDLRGIRLGQTTSAVSYLGHVGFFEYVGIGFGNAPGNARGSSKYLPLTVIRRAELSPSVKGEPMQSQVTKRCRHLASMLLQDDSEQDVLEYCFREIVRNVFEHSGADQCTLMAQCYGANQVEIAIADAGVGIHETLGSVHNLSSASDSVKAALEPGITRVTGEQSGTPWDNTGFGLYVVSQLGIAAGSFTIVSSGVCLTRTESSDTLYWTSMHGTTVRLLVNVDNAEYFANRLQQIVDRGETLASLDTRSRRPASLSTRRME